MNDEQLKEVVRVFTDLFRLVNGQSNTCPFCGGIARPLKQVGRSVYGSCGCRLYHGKV